MKTAGQLFLEWYNNYVKVSGCAPSDYDVNFYWTGNLETEKQQIIDAWIDGDARICQTKSIPHAEEYYTSTYTTKK